MERNFESSDHFEARPLPNPSPAEVKKTKPADTKPAGKSRKAGKGTGGK